ncbi:unnamed protein product [Periconia digitata]|uniref:Uncharacterized protein n=1 Tax=Periconia digitata TaxID=1303443 RepID=A0A9W4UTC8_9PLEO|nr:unnamed protein product [Periconia digitata]
MKASVSIIAMLGLVAHIIAAPTLGYGTGNLLKRGDCVQYMMETSRAANEQAAQDLCKSALGPDGEEAPGMSADTW